MKVSHVGGLCIAAVFLGCSPPVSSPVTDRVGQSCEVQFRRDGLGAAAPSGISPKTGEFNGMPMNMYGTLKRAQVDSILLNDGQFEYLIPMHAILYLKFDEVEKVTK
jgi:hypothetical protein